MKKMEEEYIKTSWNNKVSLKDWQERLMLKEFVEINCKGSYVDAANILRIDKSNLYKYVKGEKPVPVHVVKRFGFKLVQRNINRKFRNMRS